MTVVCTREAVQFYRKRKFKSLTGDTDRPIKAQRHRPFEKNKSKSSSHEIPRNNGKYFS